MQEGTAPLFIPDSGKIIDFCSYPVASISGQDGLVAVGANFLPGTLLSAYRCGVFPWFIYKGYAYWYCPDPRLVLCPGDIHISKSMHQVLRRKAFEVTCDQAFEEVMNACASVRRKNEDSSWIDREYIEAYVRVHRQGYAHSFECWQEGQLVGGLYGLGMGRIFFGESMFSLEKNASKIAFIQAIKFLEKSGFLLIDCQVPSAHLQSLGAITMRKKEYLLKLKSLVTPGSLDGISWNGLFKQDMAE
jgi:leucyl/phenylalanyl-tRNA--protein transferase